MTDDYLGPEPTRDETAFHEEENWNRAMGSLKATALQIKTDRDRYEAALRKIAAWKGYSPNGPLTGYETGANDMLGTLAGFAKEALA